MKTIKWIALAAGVTAIAACGHNAPAGENNTVAEPAGTQTDQVYSGTGTVKAIAGDKVAIAHGPIAGIGWPAMTMTFTAPAGMAATVKPGSLVDFSFRQNGASYLLTSLRPR